MPTSVVTGGAGFLGSHLCEALLGEAIASSASTTSRPARSRTSSTCAATRSSSVPHDLTQHVEIDEPVDFVYHLASPASPIDYLRLPLQTLKVGSYGTHNALGLAKVKRARFLLASTSEVYGDPQVHPQPETYWGHVNPIGPRGVYDEAKRYAEALTMAYHRQQGVDTAIVRIFNTYGPRMRPHDGRAIPTFIRQALEEKPLTVFGDGSQTRSFCYVDDLVRGLILLAESGEHLPVNIGNPTEMTLLELAEAVVRATGSSSQIVFEALPVDDPQVRQPDITRARAAPRLGARDRARRGPAPHAGVARPGTGRCVGRLASLAAAISSSRRSALASTAAGIAVPPAGHLRRRPDPLRQPGQTSSRSSRQMDTQLVRVNLWWGGPERRRHAASPPTPSEPGRSRLRLGDLRPHACATRERTGCEAMFSILGTPALGERRPGLEHRRRRRPPTCSASSIAAARRYSGTYARRRTATIDPAGAHLDRLERAEQPGLPQAAVRPLGLEVGDPERQGLRADLQRDRAGRASRSTARARSPAASPRRAATTTRARSRPSVSPLAFLRAMKAAGATGFDAYAHHPYYGSPHGDADHEAAARQARAARRRPSRSATSTC